MKSLLNIVLCSCGHLTSGTGEAEFEALYINEIKPLILALEKHPKVNFVFYYSGVLLYWIERRHSELFMLLGELLYRRQVEILGGGFYNPALNLIPSIDKIGQIEMLNTYIRRHFGRRPQGCWLPSVNWEQDLVGPLNSCGMSYTFLDESQFASSGINPGAGGLYPPAITEDQGKLISIFPIASSLGEKILNGDPQKIISDISEVYMDKDWDFKDHLSPQTFKGTLPTYAVIPIRSPYSKTNLSFYEDLFTKLTSMPQAFEFNLPGRIFRNLKGQVKAYFPFSDAPLYKSPRHFLMDYPEAGNIYAKTIYVHTLIKNRLRGDKTRKRTAYEELWKAQDSGIFMKGNNDVPGLYCSNIRKAAYRALLESEKITREKSKFVPSLSVFDFDLDGEGEYVFQDDKVNCYIKSRGAGIFELDYLPSLWNYLDTMAINRNAWQRSAFNDWLAPENTGPEQTAPEGIWQGRYCGTEVYETLDIDRVKGRAKFLLPAREKLPWGEIEIEKVWQLKKNTISLEYLLRNTKNQSISFVFSPQIDLSFPGTGERNLRIFSVAEGEKSPLIFENEKIINDIKSLEFQDIENEAIISLDCSRTYKSRIFHIVQDIGGYQSTCLMPVFPVNLENGKTWKLSFSLKISS